jgi:branched-chain amino acid transport system permease protein
MIFGNTTTSITTPISGFAVGSYQVNGYNFFIIFIACILFIAMYAVLKTTRLGLIARGTMQRSDIAAALGYSPDRIYMATFFCGSALTGLAGAVFAPLVGLVPTSGSAYMAKGFITVVAGGPAMITGLLSSSTIFGSINQIITFASSSVFGEVAILLAAIIILRLIPQGITSRFFKGKM